MADYTFGPDGKLIPVPLGLEKPYIPSQAEKMQAALSAISRSGTSSNALSAASRPTSAFRQHLATGQISSNIEDRTGQTYSGTATPLTGVSKLASSGPSKDVIDTMIAEAGGNIKGLHAVAAVIINRAKAQGKTPLQIVQQRGQFEGYSKPGRESVKAQQIASVRANASKAFNDILTGAVADPLKGGKDFRSDAAANGLHAPHGTISIGGNTFALGNSPTTAVAAIGVVAPEPHSFPSSLSAYADTPSVASVPLPIPRPSNAPGSTPPLVDALRAKYTSVAPSADAASSYGNILPPALQNAAPPLPRPRPNIVPQGLTSRPVQTVPIDPYTGSPYASASQYAADTEAARLRAARQVPQPLVSEDHPRSNAVVPQPKVTFPTTAQGPVPTEFQRTNPLGSLFNQQPSLTQTPSVGAIKTLGQAGQVGLPQGVVPASVTRDLASIAGMQMNRSGSPDDRHLPTPQIAPTPMPGRPVSLNAPYIPGPNGYSSANKDSRTLPAGLTDAMGYGPPAHVTQSGPVQAITSATKPLAQPIAGTVAPVPMARPITPQHGQIVTGADGNKYQYVQTSGGNFNTASANGSVPTWGWSRVGSSPVPHVPVPSPTMRPLTSFNTVNPASQIVPNIQSGFRSTPIGHIGSLLAGEPIQGGLLGLLFGGGNPLASLFGTPSQPQSPGNSQPINAAQLPGSNFLSDRGVNTSGLTIGQQQNELNYALAGNRSGSV